MKCRHVCASHVFIFEYSLGVFAVFVNQMGGQNFSFDSEGVSNVFTDFLY